MSSRSNSGAVYYRPSGEFSPVGVLLVLAIATPAAALLAAIYAYLILYIPIAGYVTFILSAGFGLLMGVATSARLRSSKVRNVPLAWLLGTLIALVGFYVHWAVWSAAFLARGDVDVSILQLLDPSELWRFISLVNEDGAWSMKGFKPTGAALWGFWGVEALLILGPAIVVAGMAADQPFCERCQKWCDDVDGLHRLKLHDAAAVRAKAEAKDFAALAQLGRAEGDASRYLRVDLKHCPDCDQTSTLTIQDVTVTIDKEGKPSVSTDTAVKDLVLSAGELAQVRALAPLEHAQAPSEAAVPA